MFYFFNKKAKQSRVKNIVSSNFNISSEPEESPMQIILSETKSFEFRADRRDYVDYNEAMEWCDSISNIILDILKENPEHKFLITGYAANFNNEIDSDVLALERADNIKKELVNRGIPKDLLSTISGGTTSRWGIERNANRAVTIKSIEQ